MAAVNAAAAGTRTHSVRFYLVLLTLAVAIPLAGLSFYVSARIAAAERESTEAVLLNNAGSLAAAVDQEIDKHIAVAATLAHSKSLQDGNWPDFWQRAKASLNELPDSWLVVLDPTGQVLLNTRLPPGRALPHRPLFDTEQRALRTHKPEVSDIVAGYGTHQLKSFAVVPVFRDGRIVYLIDITLSPERFVVLLQNQKYLKNWLAAIVDRSNHFLARLPDAEGTKLGQPASKGWQSAIERNRSGVVYHVATDGHRIIDGYTHTAYGWTVGIGIRESILKAPLRRTQWMLAAACLGCIGLGVLLAWLVARRLHRSAMQLKNAATAIASEQPLNVAPTGVREYDDAVAAIAVASQALHARAQERDRAWPERPKRIPRSTILPTGSIAPNR